jgi:capsular polysaccharide biosynthesis protein
MAVAAETLTLLVRRWWLITLLTALGAGGGLAYALLAPPEYTAKAYVVVVAQNPGDSTAVSYAQAYARIAGQGDALNAAAEASDGATSVKELRRNVRASASPDAPVIEVTGSAGSARRAADLANLLADGLISTANSHRSDTRMRLALLSAAGPPADPTSPQMALSVAVGAAVGLLLGALALLGGTNRASADRKRADRVPVGPTEPAADTAVPDLDRWTGRAPVIVTGTSAGGEQQGASANYGHDGQNEAGRAPETVRGAAAVADQQPPQASDGYDKTDEDDRMRDDDDNGEPHRPARQRQRRRRVAGANS